MADTSASEDESLQVLRRRVRDLEKRRDDLKAQLSSPHDDVSSRWLKDVQIESTLIRELETSMSWRITKPLRVLGSGSKKPRSFHPLRASRTLAKRLRRRFSDR